MTKRINTSRIIPSVGKKSRNVVTTEISVVKISIRRLKPVWSAIAPKMGDKNAIRIALMDIPLDQSKVPVISSGAMALVK